MSAYCEYVVNIEKATPEQTELLLKVLDDNSYYFDPDVLEGQCNTTVEWYKDTLAQFIGQDMTFSLTGFCEERMLSSVIGVDGDNMFYNTEITDDEYSASEAIENLFRYSWDTKSEALEQIDEWADGDDDVKEFFMEILNNTDWWEDLE